MQRFSLIVFVKLFEMPHPAFQGLPSLATRMLLRFEWNLSMTFSLYTLPSAVYTIISKERDLSRRNITPTTRQRITLASARSTHCEDVQPKTRWTAGDGAVL